MTGALWSLFGCAVVCGARSGYGGGTVGLWSHGWSRWLELLHSGSVRSVGHSRLEGGDSLCFQCRLLNCSEVSWPKRPVCAMGRSMMANLFFSGRAVSPSHSTHTAAPARLRFSGSSLWCPLCPPTCHPWLDRCRGQCHVLLQGGKMRSVFTAFPACTEAL